MKDSSAEPFAKSPAVSGGATDRVVPRSGDSLRQGSPESPTEIWLDGGVLACACLQCGAPMSIRLWLRMADCWRCGLSIELTEEQEQQAMRLLQQWEAEREQRTADAAAEIRPTISRAVPKTRPTNAEPKPSRAPSAKTGRWAAEVAPGTSPKLTLVPQEARHRGDVPRREWYRQAAVGARPRSAAHAFWSDLPAWLISLIFHMVALLLLALLTAPDLTERAAITLSTSINYRDIEGEEGLLQERDVLPTEFEESGLAVPIDIIADAPPGVDEVKVPALADPAPLNISSLVVDSSVTSPLAPPPVGVMFAGRDPSVRSRLLEQGGGTNETEAAVARGLRWLSRYQNRDGSWSLHAFHRAPGAVGDEDGLGQESDVAGTALALLPFLGAGQTHRDGEYKSLVLKGLNWLVGQQKKDGDLRGSGIGDMYAHAQAAIVLCEAYAMTRDPQLREPAQKALDFIVRAQHPAGGWRYDPGQAGDTSVLGWQLMALRSGKMAYLRVPDRVFAGASRYLDSAQADRYGGRYSYLPGGGATPTMTAEALLCRQYLGWPRDHQGLKSGAYYLLNEHRPGPQKLDTSMPWFYYIYYATQVMHHMGGDFWRQWNDAMKKTLLTSQRKTGSVAGSWDPLDQFGRQGGRIYTTALAICTLEVYYRHMPLYDPAPALLVKTGEPGDEGGTPNKPNARTTQ